MTDTYENYEIIFAVYSSEDGAAGAVDALKRMDDAKSIKIIDAATLIKDAEGNTTVKQESLPSVKKGLGVGALIGGAVGLLFPPSILAAAAIGAGVGAGSAKLAKMALESDDLQESADRLEPGSSAFIAVVENTWVKQLQETIAGYESLSGHTLTAEASGVLGTLESESGSVVYGNASTEDGALEFVAASDGTSVAGHATAAAIAEDGSVVVQDVRGVATTDEDGNVEAIGAETIAAVDADGNAVVEQTVVAGEALDAGDEESTPDNADS
ncbi:MAG: DUF1269 domain-containing protein [Acidimicrobiia bacterium]